MKRFTLIFFSLACVELGIYLSPLRIDKTDNPNAKFTVPFGVDSLEMKYNGHILVKAYINNDTTGYWFLWDTGAQASFLDDELVEQYKLREIGIGRSVDSNLKARQTIRYRVDSLKFGHALFEDFIFSGLTIEKPECSEKKYRGIIGANIIGNTNWLIDYQNQKMLIIESDTANAFVKRRHNLSDTLDSYTIPFNSRDSKGVPKVLANIKGEVIDDVIFDTGYTGTIVLPMKIFNRSDSLSNDSSSLKSYGEISKGLFGSVSGSLVQMSIDSIKLGNLYLENQLVNFQSKTVKLLGNKILKNYNLFLRYDTNEIEMVRLPAHNSGYTVKKRGFGFSFKLIDDELTVTMVQENSPAHDAGLEYEDKILCINEAEFHGDQCEVNEWYSNFLCETILLEVEDKGTLELEYLK